MGLRRVSAQTAATAAAFLLAALAPATAPAAPAPPFAQCPRVGEDPSCGTLIVVGPSGSLEAFNDPRVGHIGFDDSLIGVQNDSPAPLRSIPITSTPFHEIYDFDGNGICGAAVNVPAGCPFGPNLYEGPGVEFDTVRELVEFAGEGLAPGASAYFGLEGVSLTGLTELACGGELEQQGCHTLEPTTLATTLSAAGRSGSAISVLDGTAASAQATLTSNHPSQAGGTIEYDVYSDPGCTQLVAGAGAVAVSEGAGPASDAETLAPGTYYWQATYSGDAHNAGSHSPCASAIEFVKPECRAVSGVGHIGPRGPQGLTEANRLDTSGSPHRLTIAEPDIRVRLRALTSGSCVDWHEFSGAGPAQVNGVGGYLMSFALDVTLEGLFLTVSVEKEGDVVLSLERARLNRTSRERFS